MKKQRGFQEGLIYVFTMKKFIKKEGRMGEVSRSWVKELNGQTVNVLSKSTGRIGIYFVNPDWCKCIGKEQTND
jgi:hypothetical protein